MLLTPGVSLFIRHRCAGDAGDREVPPAQAGLCTQLVLYLRCCHLPTLFVKWEHHRDPVTQGQVIPREVKPLPALVRPGRADARPDLLAVLVFARVPAVVEDICWCVRHRSEVIDTVCSVWHRQGTSIHRAQRSPGSRAKSGVSAWGRGTLGESAAPPACQKGTILEGW
jgi:hypothetical protein